MGKYLHRLIPLMFGAESLKWLVMGTSTLDMHYPPHYLLLCLRLLLVGDLVGSMDITMGNLLGKPISTLGASELMSSIE